LCKQYHTLLLSLSRFITLPAPSTIHTLSLHDALPISVNTIFLATFTYGRGIAGRQVPGQPLPDHGKQEYDRDFHGGNFATPHPRSEEHTSELQSPDHLVCRLLLAKKKITSRKD